ncbi:X8 domain [Dillenia turbinata]|uniref:X8 domain n=1 Tax=Dillenia turbinata TaxID=194707 RepID=A0AAN8UZP9_9MAGN
MNSSDAQEQIWCVASPKATDAMLWPALQWVCANGADCSQLQEDQPCYDPDTVSDHASYAFNNYWQRSKKLGGLCNFNNLAIPTNVDPSKAMVLAVTRSFPNLIVQEAWSY